MKLQIIDNYIGEINNKIIQYTSDIIITNARIEECTRFKTILEKLRDELLKEEKTKDVILNKEDQ